MKTASSADSGVFSNVKQIMVLSLFSLLSPLYLCLPDSIEEGEVGVGRQGGNQGEGSRDQDPEAEQPFASDELSHSPSRHLE